MPPTVGLNLLFLDPGATGGMEVYARALVPELVRAWPEAGFVAFVGRELGTELRARPWAPGLRVVALPVSSGTRVRRSLAEQTLLAGAVLRARVDLLHSLGTTTPVAPGPPTVVTIHDVLYARFPDAHAGLLQLGMSRLVPLAARRARRIVCDSRASRDDLVELLGITAERIDVVHLGPGLPPAATPTPERALRARLGLGDGPLVFTVSAKRPHKNLARLIEATARLTHPATLVVPGYPTAHEAELAAHAQRVGAGERVVFCGWVADADLEGLYAAATCVALPSLGEGFGLPALEAMARGVPVACANVSALPEVAGDAALLFDPTDVGAIAAALDRLLAEPALRADLVARGRARAAGFSWARAAEETVASYERVLTA